jgi:hypothetical protein
LEAVIHRELMELADCREGIGWVLEQTDGCDAGGACVDARGRILEGDASDGEHGNGDCTADFGKAG